MTYRERMRAHARAELLGFLQRNSWCVSSAAREAKLGRSHLYMLLREHDIKLPPRALQKPPIIRTKSVGPRLRRVVEYAQRAADA